MSTAAIIAIAVCAVIALVAWMQARAQSGTYKSLSSRAPQAASKAVPLGMEATDLALVNRISRRNESLERANTSLTNKDKKSRLNGSDLHIEPWADDETYAKRFHSVFQQKDKGSKT